MTKAFVLGRRRKGRHIGRLVRDVRADLRAGGWKVDSRTVRRKRTMRRVAADQAAAGMNVIVAVGGDGAVGQIATSLAGTGVALGIVPAGTGNLLASNLGSRNATTMRQSAASRSPPKDRSRQVSVGGADHDFAVACGIGFDAGVVGATDSRQKLQWGRLAISPTRSGRPGDRQRRPKITLDGVRTTTDAAQVFIANFGKLLPLVEPRRKVRPDDGWFDVIVVRASGPLPGLLATWEVLRQKELGSDPNGHVFRARAREVRVDTRPARLVEADGNVVGSTPIVARIRPRALTVVVPKR